MIPNLLDRSMKFDLIFNLEFLNQLNMQYNQFDFNKIAARRVCLKDTLLLFVEFCVSCYVFMLAECIISGWVALKLFLSSMSFLHVVFQIASSNAGKIANFAFLRLFSTMGELVSLQVLSLTE